jgi:hypothetical protein
VSCGEGADCEFESGWTAEALLGDGVEALGDPLFMELQAERLAAARTPTTVVRRIFRMTIDFPFGRQDRRLWEQPQGGLRRSRRREMA